MIRKLSVLLLSATLCGLGTHVALAGDDWDDDDDRRRAAAVVDVDFGVSCTSVNVVSTQKLRKVALLFEEGGAQVFKKLRVGHSGEFAGTGDHAGKTIVTAYVKSGPVRAKGKKEKKRRHGMGMEFTSPCSGASPDPLPEPPASEPPSGPLLPS